MTRLMLADGTGICVCQLDRAFAENMFLDLSQYTRNYAVMMVRVGGTDCGNGALLK
jgi:hypothetical protein